jgi:hypothetical protein
MDSLASSITTIGLPNYGLVSGGPTPHSTHELHLRRIMFPHLDADHWRDYTAMNEWVVRNSFPSITAEFSHDWVDRA